MEQVHSDLIQTAVYDHLDNYDWDNDNEFQGGLNAILKSASPEQAPRLIVRAKCYYFARKFGSSVDFDGYLKWTQSRLAPVNGNRDQTHTHEQSSLTSPASEQEAPQQSSGTMGTAPHPASFAEICELIAEGKPIPGIKDIPDTVLEGQASQSQATLRKKPWEKEADPVPTPSWARAA